MLIGLLVACALAALFAGLFAGLLVRVVMAHRDPLQRCVLVRLEVTQLGDVPSFSGVLRELGRETAVFADCRTPANESIAGEMLVARNRIAYVQRGIA